MPRSTPPVRRPVFARCGPSQASLCTLTAAKRSVPRKSTSAASSTGSRTMTRCARTWMKSDANSDSHCCSMRTRSAASFPGCSQGASPTSTSVPSMVDPALLPSAMRCDDHWPPLAASRRSLTVGSRADISPVITVYPRRTSMPCRSSSRRAATWMSPRQASITSGRRRCASCCGASSMALLGQALPAAQAG